MSSTNPILKVSHLRKSFGSTQVLKDISFDLNAGEVLSIIGPSGSGKSTLLRCITQLETIGQGFVSVDGKEMILSNTGNSAKYAASSVLREIRRYFRIGIPKFQFVPAFDRFAKYYISASSSS